MKSGNFLGQIIALFILPAVFVGLGYVGGLVVMWIYGSTVSDGFNVLFGTDRFTPHTIPTITAALGLMGSFVKQAFISPTPDKKAEKQGVASDVYKNT